MDHDQIDSSFDKLHVGDNKESKGIFTHSGDYEDKLIIGLDFGTTYSGVAYGFTGMKKSPLISISDWPGAAGRKWEKAPTTIRYDDQDKKSIKWGYELQQYGIDKIEGIKLLLDPDQRRPIYVKLDGVKAEVQRLGKPPVEIAADYIAAIYKHALAKIASQWEADFLSIQHKKFVLSVPAVWSDKAKDSTLRAARRAGIHNIDLIKEPEAAALYTLHDLQDQSLKVGDAFVLCDAGGGTVDLISYEITKLKPLELRELVPGTGGLSGSLMLNKRFEEVLEAAVGKEQFIKLQKNEGFLYAMQQFDESIKPSFNPLVNPENQRNIYVSFPKADLKDDPVNSIQSNTYTLTNDTLLKIFQPLVDDIQNLVKDQVQSVKLKRMEEQHPNASEIKAIFLVGGFGASNYLRECLQRAFPKIQVIQPHDAWSAIVRGAVLSQLPQEDTATIISTVATRHYGVAALSPIEPGDEGQPTIWDSFKQRNRVAKMQWYIYKEDEIKRDAEIRFPFYRSINPEHTEDLIFEDELMDSDAVEAPKYPCKGATKANCTLTADFRNVPASQFRREKGKDGKEYYDVHYELVVTLKTAIMRFSAEIDGKEMGSITADYK